MWLRPSFIAPLKTDIKARFFTAYGKQLTIPDDKLIAFVQRSGFHHLHEATVHFGRVIQYYQQKYSFVPSFNHLISKNIPILRNTAEWEQSLNRRFPQFRPYLFSPAKTALSTEYSVFETVLCSEDSLALALKLAEIVRHAPRLRYVPSAVILLERAMFTMAYRNVGSDIPFIPVIQAHNRLSKLRVPRRDTLEVWERVHFALSVVRKTHFRIGVASHPWWNALKIIISDALWPVYSSEADDREIVFQKWMAETQNIGPGVQLLVDSDPLPLTLAELTVLDTAKDFHEVAQYYPYKVG